MPQQTTNHNPQSTSPQEPDLNWILANLSGPNSSQAIAAYNKLSGLDVTGRYQGYNAARYMLPMLYMQLASQGAFNLGLQPLLQQIAGSTIARMTNKQAAVDDNRAMLGAQVGSTLTNVLQRLKSGGVGIGAQQGAALDTMNRKTAAGNAFQANSNSNQGQIEGLSALAAYINGQQPNFGPLSEAQNIMLGTPRNTTLGDVAGGIAGTIAGKINWNNALGLKTS